MYHIFRRLRYQSVLHQSSNRSAMWSRTGEASAGEFGSTHRYVGRSALFSLPLTTSSTAPLRDAEWYVTSDRPFGTLHVSFRQPPSGDNQSVPRDGHQKTSFDCVSNGCCSSTNVCVTIRFRCALQNLDRTSFPHRFEPLRPGDRGFGLLCEPTHEVITFQHDDPEVVAQIYDLLKETICRNDTYTYEGKPSIWRRSHWLPTVRSAS